jgi:predicted  nucleic acid-binding Zn-ribbon protein
MTLDLRAIRERVTARDRVSGKVSGSIAQQDRRALLAEVDRLRAVLAESDAKAAQLAYEVSFLSDERDWLREQLSSLENVL